MLISHCRASVGGNKVTDIVFLDNAVLLVESLEVLVLALIVLQKGMEPLGLKVSRAKTKTQLFGGLLDDKVQSVHACREDLEVTKSFTCLDSLVHNNGGY